MIIKEYCFEVTLYAAHSDGAETTYNGYEWAEGAIAAIHLRCSRHGIDPAKLLRAEADYHGGRSERTMERVLP
jgi:hypothetical protein